MTQKTSDTLTIVPDDLAPRDAYRLLIGVVIPRPIAWVSTMGADGASNLAPYSFFNGVNGSPPIVMISISRLRSGRVKDTLRNIQETDEFVVNLVDETLAEAMNLTSGEWDYGISEFEVAGLDTAPSVDVRPPRVAVAPVSLEARTHQIVPVEGTASTLVLGRVVRFHLRADLLRSDGSVDAAQMRPLARLGSDQYATLGHIFELPRPQV